MIFGKLDRKITIQQPTYTTDSQTGERKVSAWSTYKSVWAKIIQRNSLENISADQIVLVDTYDITIRYKDAPAVKGDMRISYNSQEFYIMGIKELGRQDGLMITATKRDN